MKSALDPSLSEAEWEILEDRADRFHEARLADKDLDWSPFITDLAENLRVAVSRELIIIDLGLRWKKGEKTIVEDYAKRLPELSDPEKIPLKLIIEEYRCRRTAGEKDAAETIINRFPTRREELRGALAGDVAQPTVSRYGDPNRTLDPAKPTGEQWSAETVVSVSQRYQLVKKLGAGNFGEVWLASSPSGINKAIKILTQAMDRDAAQRELRSLELIKNLRHPYLLATEDFWVSNNRLHICMELADSTLRGRLRDYQDAGMPGIPEAEIISYFREAAEGLDYLHTKKVTHRDVKPDNILLLEGHAKVADFGLARQQEKIMASMSFAGTPVYMAPEVWGGEGGPASDQYSLAFAYVELRQGRSPLTPAPLTEMMLAHLEGRYHFESLIGPAERAVLTKALSRLPEDRYASCSEFMEELAGSLGLSMRSRKRPSTIMPSPLRDDPPSKAERTIRRSGTVINSPRTIGGSIGVEKPPEDIEKMRALLTGATSTARSNNTLSEESAPKEPQKSQPATGSLKQSWSGTVQKSGSRPTPATPASKLLIAGVLIFAILGGVGGLIWLAVGGNQVTPTPDTSHSTDTGTTPVTKPTQETKATPDTGGESTAPTQKKVDSPPLLPTGAAPAPGPNVKEVVLADGRKVYNRIVIPVNDTPVTFCLVTLTPRPQGSQKEFYMMESKVWVALYQSAEPGKLEKIEKQYKFGEDDPVMGLTAEEAREFAMKHLHGVLPSPEQWDRAFGYWEPDHSIVFRRGSKARYGLDKPDPTHGQFAGGDENIAGLWDMAGNGREWTCRIWRPKGESERNLGEKPLTDKDLVILRGRNYTLSTPLDFEKLKYEQENPQTQFGKVGSRYTGFRVVVPIP